jgi:hypothetical protein
MAAFSNYMEDAITAWINGTTFPSAPTNTYVQLYSQDPTDAGSATGALYTRVTYAASGWTRGTGGAGTLSNTNAITMQASAGSSATASHFAVFDAATSGNLLFYGALSASKTIAIGDEVKFNALQLTLTVA